MVPAVLNIIAVDESIAVVVPLIITIFCGSAVLDVGFIDEAIAEIDAYIDKIPCSELLPLKAILGSVKGVLEIRVSKINLNGLATAVSEAVSQREAIASIEDCMKSYETALAASGS